MARPLKYDTDTVDIKLTIPRELRDKGRLEKGFIFSEFLTEKLYEHFLEKEKQKET